MISNHKIQAALDEIKEISKIDLALYTDKGKQVAATFEPEGDMEYAVNSFAGSMAESQMLSGCHFFKVYVDGELEYVLLTKSSAEDAYMVGKLAVCQIRTLVSAYMEQFDRNNFMQNILLGNMLVVDMYNKAQKLHIEQAERVVFVIEIDGKKDATAMETVKNLFVTKTRDYVTEVDEQSIVLIKDTRDMKEDEELQTLARMIVDNMHTEAMVKVRVGYGNRVHNLQDIAKSYQEAKMALEVVDGLWPKKKELERIRSAVAAALKEARLPAHRAERVCGVGGTARAALKIANDWYEKPAGNRILTPAEVRRLTKLLLKRDHQTRKLILRHCPDRVHTILPGIVLMDALTEALCEGELYISPYGVREGYLCHKLLNAGT